MQRVIKKLVSDISITPQDFHLKPEMFGGEEQSPAPSPANGGRKSSQRHRKKHVSEYNHWIRKKVDKLSVQLRPVPVKPLLLDIGAHKSLLVSLGLWDFLHFGFDGEIRREMLTELVASYKYHREQYKGVGYVHGLGISLSRAAVAYALHLPVEKVHEKARGVIVSESEGLFIQKLFWDWIILKDEGDDIKMKYVLTFAEELKKSRFERADWAGLIWFMVERELKKGENLVNCHYSSHLQALLKHQRPELFEDDQGQEVVRSADKNSGKEVVDVGDGVESGLNASFLMKCCKRERKFLDEDVVGVHDEGDRLRKLHCSDLAGREFGGDYLVIEGGNQKGVCQGDTVGSLEKKEEFLLHFQDQPQPIKIGESSTDFNCFADGEFRDDDQLKEGGILEGVCPGDVVDALENMVNVLPNLQANVDKEIPVSGCEMEDEVNEVEYKTSTLEKEDVIQSEANVVKEDNDTCEMEVEVNEVEYKTSTLEKEDVIQSEANVVKEDKETEEFEAEVGNSLDGGTEDKENESSVKREAKLEQVQHQPQLKLNYSTDDNGESLADLAGGEVDCQEVDLSYIRVDVGRDVDSVALVDLFAQEVCDKEVNKQPVDMGDDSMATSVNQPHEAKLGDLLCDEEQELHMVKYQHQPELGLEGNGESLENQTVDVSGKEFVLEISKEEDEHLFLQKKVGELLDVEMDSGGTEDDAMATVVNQTSEVKLGDEEIMKFPKIQIKTAQGFCSDSLGQFPFETDMAGYSFDIPAQYEQDAGTDNMVGMSLEHAGCSFGIPAQHGQEADTNNVTGTSEEHAEDSMDLDLCAEKMKSSIAMFMELARRKLEANNISNSKLQKKIGEKNQIIQQYELMLEKETQQTEQSDQMLQMERQQKQKSDRKYERELYQMQRVLEDYRKAIKETNNSFAKYRERMQLPEEEPLYMPHPDGGGEVILVSEWKKLEKERQEMAIEAAVKEFEEVIMIYMEELLSVLETYCDRLEALEQNVRTMMRGRF